MQRDLLEALGVPEVDDDSDAALVQLSEALTLAQRGVVELAQRRADAAVAAGLRNKDLARLLGVGPSTASAILARARKGARARGRW